MCVWVGSDEMRAHRMMSEGDSGGMVRRREGEREKKHQLDEGCNFYTDSSSLTCIRMRRNVFCFKCS